MATNAAGVNNSNDDAPPGWTQTTDDKWTHESGALVRIRTQIPLRSAEKCNHAECTDATGQFEVLYHAEPLPCTPDEIAVVGTRAAALKHARDAMEARQ